jgi:O-antigen ligase/polysaccharide polymerase Wzy-like membrane protein
LPLMPLGYSATRLRHMADPGPALEAAVVLAALGLAVLVFATTRRPEPQERGYALLRLLIVIAWLYSVVPGYVQVSQSGRAASLTTDAVTTFSPIAGRLALLLTAMLILTAIVGATHYGVRMSTSDAGGTVMAVALLPWLVAGALAFYFGDSISVQVAVYPALMFLVWRAAPPLQIFATLGTTVGLTALLSIFLGLFTDYGTLNEQEFVDKAIFASSALAGPFSHPNQLGTVMAVGLPAVLLIPSRTWRWTGVILVLWATGWSASRTSLAAEVAVLGLLLVSRSVQTAGVRRTLAVGALVVVSVIIVLAPLTNHSFTAYNGRGRVWIGSLDIWRDSPWLGAGPDIYRDPGWYSLVLGPFAFHGHNLLVDTLAISGLVGLVAVAVFLVVVASCAIRSYAEHGETFGLAFVATFLAVGVLEVATDFWRPSPTALPAWLSLAAVLFARSQQRSGDVGSGPEVEEAPSGRDAVGQSQHRVAEAGEAVDFGLRLIGNVYVGLDERRPGRNAYRRGPQNP